VRTLALIDVSSENTQYIKTEGGYQALEFSQRQASQAIKVEASQSLTLFEKDIGEPPVYSEAQNIKVPDDAKSVLILATDQDGVTKYQAVDDELNEISPSKWLMLNTTSKDISFQFGTSTKALQIKANSNLIYEIPESASESEAVLARAELNGRLKTFYSTYWSMRGKHRCILIFAEVGNKIKVTRIRDHLTSD